MKALCYFLVGLMFALVIWAMGFLFICNAVELGADIYAMHGLAGAVIYALALVWAAKVLDFMVSATVTAYKKEG